MSAYYFVDCWGVSVTWKMFRIWPMATPHAFHISAHLGAALALVAVASEARWHSTPLASVMHPLVELGL